MDCLETRSSREGRKRRLDRFETGIGTEERGEADSVAREGLCAFFGLAGGGGAVLSRGVRFDARLGGGSDRFGLLGRRTGGFIPERDNRAMRYLQVELDSVEGADDVLGDAVCEEVFDVSFGLVAV